MATIRQLDEGRNNNFDLLRFMAASIVILSHSFLVTGNFFSGPMSVPVNYLDPGGLGVKIFFAISGFLITKSMLRQPTPGSFVLARCLRIFPGLFVTAIFCAFIVGPLCTTLPLNVYLQSRMVYAFAIRLATLHNFGNMLPGTFASTPYPNAINSPVWTLPAELIMYLCVLIGGIGRLLWLKQLKTVLYAIPVLIAVALFFAGIRFDSGYVSGILYWAVFFALGSACYLWRRYVPIHIPALLIAAAIYATTPFWGLNHWATTYIKPQAFAVILTYGIMVIAYHPKLQLKGFHKFGDFSYGLYIYAFPLQQILVYKFNVLNPFVHFLATMPLTLLMAIPSWYLVEKPLLKLKARRKPKPAIINN